MFQIFRRIKDGQICSTLKKAFTQFLDFECNKLTLILDVFSFSCIRKGKNQKKFFFVKMIVNV